MAGWSKIEEIEGRIRISYLPLVRTGSIRFLSVLNFAFTRLSQIDNNPSTPLRIASVRVDGTPNTRRSFLSSLIRPQLPSAHPTLESVLHTTRQITQSLHESDIFQSVEAKIENSRDALARDGDVDIIFKTREKGRFFLNTSTEVGNGEGNAVCFLPLLRMIFHSF